MTNESESETTTPAAAVPDIGPMVLAQLLERLGIEPEWRTATATEATLWEHRVHLRVRVDGPVGEGEDALWQLRGEIPFLTGVPDAPEAWAMIDRLNREGGAGAWTFDPEVGAISCLLRMDFTASIAWWVPIGCGHALGLALARAWVAAGEDHGSLRRVSEPHPVAGSRPGPGPVVRRIPFPGRDRSISIFEGGVIEGFAEHLRTSGIPAVAGPETSAIATLGEPSAPRAFWMIGTSDDRWTGPGVLTNLALAGEHGPRSAAWIANELNLRTQRDVRAPRMPNPFGAWIAQGGTVVHRSVIPASVARDISPAGPSRFVDAQFQIGLARHAWLEAIHEEIITEAAGRFPEEAMALPPSESLAAMFVAVTQGLATNEDRPRVGGPRKEGEEPGSIALAREGRIAEAEVRAGEEIEQGRAGMRRALRWRSGLRSRLERWEEALADADASLALEPEAEERAIILGDRAWYACRLGRYLEGLANADTALALHAVDPSAEAVLLVNRGINLTGLGRRAEAVAGYRRALELDPECAMAVYNIACDEAVTGAFPAALATLRRAVGIDAGLRLLARGDDDFRALAADPVHGPQLRALIGAND